MFYFAVVMFVLYFEIVEVDYYYYSAVVVGSAVEADFELNFERFDVAAAVEY